MLETLSLLVQLKNILKCYSYILWHTFGQILSLKILKNWKISDLFSWSPSLTNFVANIHILSSANKIILNFFQSLRYLSCFWANNLYENVMKILILISEFYFLLSNVFLRSLTNFDKNKHILSLAFKIMLNFIHIFCGMLLGQSFLREY